MRMNKSKLENCQGASVPIQFFFKLCESSDWTLFRQMTAAAAKTCYPHSKYHNKRKYCFDPSERLVYDKKYCDPKNREDYGDNRGTQDLITDIAKNELYNESGIHIDKYTKGDFKSHIRAFCLRWEQCVDKLGDHLPPQIRKTKYCSHSYHAYKTKTDGPVIRPCKSLACPYCSFCYRVLPIFLDLRTIFEHDAVPWKAYSLNFDLGDTLPFDIDNQAYRWHEQFKDMHDLIKPHFTKLTGSCSKIVNKGNTLYRTWLYFDRVMEGRRTVAFQPKVKIAVFSPDRKRYDFSKIYDDTCRLADKLPTTKRKYKVEIIKSNNQLAKYIGKFFQFAPWFGKAFTLYLFSQNGPGYCNSLSFGSPLKGVISELIPKGSIT